VAFTCALTTERLRALQPAPAPPFSPWCTCPFREAVPSLLSPSLCCLVHPCKTFDGNHTALRPSGKDCPLASQLLHFYLIHGSFFYGHCSLATLETGPVSRLPLRVTVPASFHTLGWRSHWWVYAHTGALALAHPPVEHLPPTTTRRSPYSGFIGNDRIVSSPPNEESSLTCVPQRQKAPPNPATIVASGPRDSSHPTLGPVSALNLVIGFCL
jgi:hypothetical protein